MEEITNNINDLDSNEQDSAMRMVKHLERKRRKQERIEKKQNYIENNLKNIKEYNDDPQGYLLKRHKMKYVLCDQCKNPRGENCE